MTTDDLINEHVFILSLHENSIKCDFEYIQKYMSIEDILFNQTLYTYKPQSRFKQPKRCTSELFYTVVFVSDKCFYKFTNIEKSGLNDEDENLIVICRNLVIENIMFR